MEEQTSTELTDEEIANANTVIIVDYEGTQSVDSVNNGKILNDSAIKEKDGISCDKKSDSQSTYMSNNRYKLMISHLAVMNSVISV